VANGIYYLDFMAGEDHASASVVVAR